MKARLLADGATVELFDGDYRDRFPIGSLGAKLTFYRSLRDQCRSAGVAFFMKQMAGVRKASMPPIPDDLMIREMPGVVR